MTDGTRPGDTVTHSLIEQLYEVAIDPANYEKLLNAWDRDNEGASVGVGIRRQLPVLRAHVDRANVFLSRYEQAKTEPVAEIVARHAPFSAIALDPQMRVVASNLSAPQLQTGGQQGQTLADVPFLSDPTAQDLRALVQQVFDSGQGGLHALSTSDQPGGGISLVKLHVASGGSGPIVVAVFSRLHWDARIEARLSAAFDLSATETQIVRQMLEMKGRAEIARARNRSVETIKRHFSAIFQKMSCRSVSEVLVLVMSFINLAAEGTAQDRPSGPAALHRVPVSKRVGQALGVTAYVTEGASAGPACMHLPGPYCLSRWPRQAEQSARARGIRIVTPVRIGYGPDAQAAPKGDRVAHVAEEYRAIMDRLGIDRAPFLAQADDLVFAFRFARTYPDRVSAIIGCGGGLPLTRSEQFDRMDRWHRFIQAYARYGPATLPFLVKAGFMLVQRVGKKRFLEMVYAKSPGDMAVFRDAESLQTMIEGSWPALSEGISAHQAFAESIASQARGDWDADVAFCEGRVPVHLFNGSGDPMVRPATLAEIAQTYPWVTLHACGDAGEFLFFQHWQEVLQTVDAYL